MRFLIIFIFLISNSFANETIGANNLVINKKLIKYDNITFENDKNNQINLIDYQGNVVMLNFWATWCTPCKEEMPSLDLLQNNGNLKNLKIFPINVGKEKKEKALKFFEDLNIKNLNLQKILKPFPFFLATLTGAKTRIKNFETVFTSSPSFLKIMRSLGAQFAIQK